MAVGGSQQTVAAAGRRWRCTWQDGSTAPRVRCRRIGGRGAFRASLSVG